MLTGYTHLQAPFPTLVVTEVARDRNIRVNPYSSDLGTDARTLYSTTKYSWPREMQRLTQERCTGNLTVKQ